MSEAPVLCARCGHDERHHHVYENGRSFGHAFEGMAGDAKEPLYSLLEIEAALLATARKRAPGLTSASRKWWAQDFFSDLRAALAEGRPPETSPEVSP